MFFFVAGIHVHFWYSFCLCWDGMTSGIYKFPRCCVGLINMWHDNVSLPLNLCWLFFWVLVSCEIQIQSSMLWGLKLIVPEFWWGEALHVSFWRFMSEDLSNFLLSSYLMRSFFFFLYIYFFFLSICDEVIGYTTFAELGYRHCILRYTTSVMLNINAIFWPFIFCFQKRCWTIFLKWTYIRARTKMPASMQLQLMPHSSSPVAHIVHTLYCLFSC